MCALSFKRIVICSITALSVILFTIVPFSPTASAAESDYLVYEDILQNLFPQYDTNGSAGNFYSIFYSGSSWQHDSSTYYKVSNSFVTEDDWTYIKASHNSSCKSAFIELNFYFTSFDPEKEYIFDFTLKFGGYNKYIGAADNLDALTLEWSNLDPVRFEPSEVSVVGSNTLAHFNFTLPGGYLDDYDEHIFKFYFTSSEYRSSWITMWLNPGTYFTVRELTQAEVDNITSAEATADAIANIGSNVPPVDFGDSTGAVTDLTDQAAAIDDQYHIDPDSTSDALSEGAATFSSADFVNASNIIKSWINNFLDSNNAIYAMLTCCLGLGLAFFAIGRSSSG